MSSDALANAKQKARRLGRKIKETITDEAEEMEDEIQDDEDKKEEKIKAEIKESMTSVHENSSLNGYDDNSYYMISDDTNLRQYGGIYGSVNDNNNNMFRMNNKRGLQDQDVRMHDGMIMGNNNMNEKVRVNNSNNMDIYPSFVNEINASSFETYPNRLQGYNADQNRQF